jgi:hypothetical protein
MNQAHVARVNINWPIITSGFAPKIRVGNKQKQKERQVSFFHDDFEVLAFIYKNTNFAA